MFWSWFLSHYYSPWCYIWRLDVGMGYYCSACCTVAENSSYLAELVLQREEIESQGAETFCSRLWTKEGATTEAEIVSSAFSSPLPCPLLCIRQESSWKMNNGRVGFEWCKIKQSLILNISLWSCNCQGNCNFRPVDNNSVRFLNSSHSLEKYRNKA